MLFFILFVTSIFLRTAQSGSSVTILVNRVELQTTNYEAKYHYADGDDVDVRCFGTHKDKCEMWLEHEHAKILREMYKVDWTYYGVGFRAFLGITHNNMTMTCNCYGYQVKIKFLLASSFDDVIKMNGVVVRNLKDIKNSYTYYCFDSSPLQLEFHNNTNNYLDTGLNFNGSINIIKRTISCEENTVSLPTDMYLHVKHYPYWFDDDSPLPYLNLTSNIILLNLYTINQDQFIYYEYEDGETLNLTCSATTTNHKYCMSTEGKTGDYNQPIPINKQLNSDDETIECKVDYLYYIHWYDRRIKVLFHKIIPTSSSYPSTTKTTPVGTAPTTTTAADTSIWPLILAVGGVICVLVGTSIITIIYWKKKRKPSMPHKDPVTKSYELQADSRTSSAPEASQIEDLYSEPYESLSKTNQIIPEITYAVLDISPISKNIKNDTETSPYAEIHHGRVENIGSEYVNI